MAWISVHEQVLGGKLRNLAKKIGCSQNEALGLLIRLWLWGINNADKEGKIIGADKEDVAEVLTIGIDNRYQVEDVVDALIDTNWIDIEEDLYLHDWDDWQEQWYKAIAVRERDAARKREERRKKREEKNAQLPQKDVSGISKKEMEAVLPSPKLIIPQEEPSKSQPEDNKYPKDFEEFWNAYPRKVGKGEAYKKYKARLNDGWSAEELITAAKNYADSCVRKRTEKEYIKHGKTFLSDSTPFIDFLPKKEVQPVSVQNDDDPYKDWR